MTDSGRARGGGSSDSRNDPGRASNGDSNSTNNLGRASNGDSNSTNNLGRPSNGDSSSTNDRGRARDGDSSGTGNNPGRAPTGSSSGVEGALLDVDGVSAGYGAAPVLRDVTLSVQAGQIVAVLGANGAGKTTLLRTISGLLPATSGRITFDGIDIRRIKVERMVRHGIAHVPEGRGVVTELTVEENLRLGGLWRKKQERQPLDSVYDLFPPLAERRDHLGHQLSGGERQMLAIGRALVSQPRLLLLDEPSLGLAPKVTAQIMALLRDLRDRTGLAVLLVEQNVRSALSVADIGIVLSLGRIAIRDSADVLARDEDLRHAYLGF
jgi:branched-chain amino acid transport system ATP-binding protein